MEKTNNFGIDVSDYQGKIDWGKVKKAGVEFVIIKCGYGDDIKEQDDKYFTHNVEGCEKNKIPYGVYIYSYAASVQQAESEANHVLRLIKGHQLTYPIFLDLEDDETSGKCSKKLLGDMAETFCNIIEAAGYKVGIYANTNWFNTKLTDKRFDKWDRWVAQYYTECEYKKDYIGWQYSNTGKIDGIKGNVDLNYFYKEYKSISSSSVVEKKKSVDELSKEVIDGKWGNGKERKDALTAAGFDYQKVQARVNEILEQDFKEYNVQVIVDALNIRKAAGTDNEKTGMITDMGTYTIVDEADGQGAGRWGKLKDGRGWIALDFVRKL